MRTDEGKRRPGTALILAENDGVEEEWDKVREVVGVEMRKQNVRNPVPVDTAGNQVGEGARAEIEQEGVIGLDEISGCGARGVHVGARPQHCDPDHEVGFS